MKLIKVRALFKINEGQLETFEQLKQQFISVVNQKEKEKGTLMYDWYVNEDTMECAVLEDYADSDAVLEHAANTGDILQELLKIGEISLEVYGNPSEELSKILVEFGAKIFPFSSAL